MSLLFQVLITGLAAGAGYGLVAIAYGLMYRLTGVVQFAIGALMSLAVFVTLEVWVGTAPVGVSRVSVVSFLPALAVAVAVATVVGGVIYFVAVRPSSGRGSASAALGWIGGTVAAAFAIRGILLAAFPRQSYVFPDPLRLSGVIRLGGGVTIEAREFVVLGLGVALAGLAALLLSRTNAGRALQAISTDRLGARAAGLPVGALVASAFALSGGLAALIAVIQAPDTPLTVDGGTLLGLKGLVAALLVRFGSPWRSFAAGLALGVFETSVSVLHIGALRLGAEYRDVLPLALVVIAVALQWTGRLHPDAE